MLAGLRRLPAGRVHLGARAFSVGVVGAGVAGLQTVHAMRLKGHTVECFETSGNVGGVWRDNYKGFGVQVPKQLYEFCDLPFDEVPHGEFPTGEQTQRYIERYADHFALRSAVRLNTTVAKATQLEDGRWTLSVVQADGAASECTFDKLVMCSGLYSAHKKFVPQEEGRADFEGDVMHTHDFRDNAQVAGKKVVVVGGAKSAIDGREPLSRFLLRPSAGGLMCS